MQYRERVADVLVQRALAQASAVVLEGPRGSGVSTTARRYAAHRWDLAGDDYARLLVDMSPHLLFDVETPTLFDEWALTPDLLPALQAHVMADPTPGRQLLTAHRTPRAAVERPTAEGALAWLRMRPMSLWESGHSTGSVSLGSLLAGHDVDASASDLNLNDLLERMVVGGWPATQELTEPKARRWLRDHLLDVVRTALPEEGVRRSEDELRRFLAVLGRGVGSEQKLAQVARAFVARPRKGEPPRREPRPETVSDYLAALRRLHLLEDQPAWMPTLTSAAPLRQGARRYFTDPSVGLSALGWGTAALKRDLDAAAVHFRAMALRDLRSYADAQGSDLQGADVLHLRDNNNRSVDAVVVTPTGEWGAINVVMNPSDTESAASSLRWLAERIDTSVEGQRAPSFLGVVTGTGSARTRPDGVHVVPLGTLAP